MAILWIIQKYKDSMKILLMNSMNKKKGVGFGFDLKIWVGFEKHPKIKYCRLSSPNSNENDSCPFCL